MRFLASLTLVLVAALALAAPASAKRLTCKQIHARSYGMHTKAGNRAVGDVVASVSPPCRGGRKLGVYAMEDKVQAGLTKVARRYEEAGDSAVVEAVANALQAAGAGYVEALYDIYPD